MVTSARKIPHRLIQRLVLTNEGLVFDPVSGRTFTVNETGLLLLRLLQEEKSTLSMIRKVKQLYNVDSRRAKHEILQFSRYLCDAFL